MRRTRRSGRRSPPARRTRPLVGRGLSTLAFVTVCCVYCTCKWMRYSLTAADLAAVKVTLSIQRSWLVDQLDSSFSLSLSAAIASYCSASSAPSAPNASYASINGTVNASNALVCSIGFEASATAGVPGASCGPSTPGAGVWSLNSGLCLRMSRLFFLFERTELFIRVHTCTLLRPNFWAAMLEFSNVRSCSSQRSTICTRSMNPKLQWNPWKCYTGGARFWCNT